VDITDSELGPLISAVCNTTALVETCVYTVRVTVCLCIYCACHYVLAFGKVLSHSNIHQ